VTEPPPATPKRSKQEIFQLEYLQSGYNILMSLFTYVTCHQELRNAILLPCYCSATCSSCVSKLWECPICNQKITNSLSSTLDFDIRSRFNQLMRCIQCQKYVSRVCTQMIYTNGLVCLECKNKEHIVEALKAHRQKLSGNFRSIANTASETPQTNAQTTNQNLTYTGLAPEMAAYTRRSDIPMIKPFAYTHPHKRLGQQAVRAQPAGQNVFAIPKHPSVKRLYRPTPKPNTSL
jgi:hypothetical protein